MRHIKLTCIQKIFIASFSVKVVLSRSFQPSNGVSISIVSDDEQKEVKVTLNLIRLFFKSFIVFIGFLFSVS